MDHDDFEEPLGDFTYGSEEFELWQERAGRVWKAYDMGVRDTRILKDLLEPDEALRHRLVRRLYKGAASGFEPQLSCLFAQVALAGLTVGVDDVVMADEPEELGWMFMHIASDAGWEPAQEIVERYRPEEA